MHSSQFPLCPCGTPHSSQEHRFGILLWVVQNHSFEVRNLPCNLSTQHLQTRLGEHHSDMAQSRCVSPIVPDLIGNECLCPTMRMQKTRATHTRNLRLPCVVKTLNIAEIDHLPGQSCKFNLALPPIVAGTVQ